MKISSKTIKTVFLLMLSSLSLSSAYGFDVKVMEAYFKEKLKSNKHPEVLETKANKVIQKTIHYGQINNLELISLEASDNKIVSFVFENENALLSKYADEVNHRLASVEKNENRPEINGQAIDYGDDLVMFEYGDRDSGEKTVFDSKNYISPTVKGAISRAVSSNQVNHKKAKSKPIVKAAKDQMDEIIKDNPDVVVYEYAKNIKKEINKKSLMQNALAKLDGPSYTHETVIAAKELKLNESSFEDYTSFEFVPDYDRAQRQSDGNTGEIRITHTLSDNSASIITGVIQGRGIIPTRVDLNLLNRKINIPVINEESTQQFLEKKKIFAQGNLILIELGNEITDVDIDSKYDAKILLNSNLKVTEDLKDAVYVLFLGTQNGNTLVRYYLNKEDSSSKIVYVGEGEMYFDSSSFQESTRNLYTVMTRSLLGKTVKELNIDNDKISLFGTTNKTHKRTINSYEIRSPDMPTGERRYLEFKHMNSPLYVGTEKENLEIPGEDFIQRVLEVHELGALGQRCMVQVNLTKELTNLTASGKNSRGEMIVETTYLDNDGNFSVDNNEWAEKLFVLGDQEGMFNIKIDYIDGSSHFLKTYCSQGQYIIEQL